jgi:type VI secretion system protein ImpJ
MKIGNRVLWAEGILLGQQHFQQWDRYHHARQDFLLRVIAPFPCGVKKLVFDEQVLPMGQIIIKECQVIFAHGLIIDYDSRFAPPLCCSLINSRSPQTEIYLAVPIHHRVKGITGYPEQNTVAWLANYHTVTDEYDPAREREVLVGQPNLCLLSGEVDHSLFYTLKIFEITKNSEDNYQLVEDYVPAIIDLASSPWLTDVMRSHIELLVAKSRVLRQRRRQFHTEVSEFNHSDLADFLLLQLFNSFVPELRELFNHLSLSPLAYYHVLIRLLGNLTTFDIQHDEWSMVDYQHEDLRQTFLVLDQQLKALLERVIPSRMAALKFRCESDTLYIVDAIDSQIFSRNSFYLAVRYEATTIEWLGQFARQVKIGARSMIESIVASALPGVSLIHTQRPPNKLPVKAGYEYFYLEPLGSFWEQIKHERTLALFTSYDFSKAQIELVTIQE